MFLRTRVLPYCIKNSPIPWCEASHSTINVFVISGVDRMGIVHITFLNYSKALVASSIQENYSFFNNDFKGVYI
jgi:hypothetical protein